MTRGLPAQRHHHGQSVDFEGEWQSSCGSILHLAMGGSALCGTIWTDFEGQGAFHEFPLVGFAHDDALSFAVDFSPHNLLAAYVGRHYADGGLGYLRMAWILTGPSLAIVREGHGDFQKLPVL